MSKPAPFGVTVTDRQPGITAVIAPERSVGSGRYRRAVRPRDKDSQQDQTHRRPRRRPRLRPRLHVPVVAAVGVATGVVVAGAVAMAQMGGSSNDAGRPPATVLETVAGAAAAGSPSGVGGADASTTVASTSVATTSVATTVATTLASATTLSPEQAQLLESVGGTFDVTRVVTRTNASFLPIGTTDHLKISLDPSCAGGACVGNSDDKPSLTVGAGGTFSYGGTAAEPCTTDPSISVIDSWKIVLRVVERDAAGQATRLRGEETLTVSDLAGCPNIEVSPVTFSLDGVRTDAAPGKTATPVTSSP